MCIIAVRPKNKTISEDTFRNCFENNPDGCGFMYAKNGVVYGKKGIMTFKDFLRENKRIPKDVTVVYHFRIQTHGGVTPKLTHPFPLSSNFEKMHKLEWWNEYGVAHNGIFSTVKAPDEESDTEVFIANILKPLQELSTLKDNKLTDKYYDDIITSAVGSSRLAIMDNTGFVKMYGSGWVNGEDGCYYSNSTYCYTRCSSYDYWYGKDSNYQKENKGSLTYNTQHYEDEKMVAVNVIAKDDVIAKDAPAYLFEEGCCFMDKDKNVYYYDVYSDAFRRSVYKAKAVFNEDETFEINVKEYKGV